MVSDQITFKLKKLKDMEAYYIQTKWLIYHENLTLINMYVLNEEASKLTKQLQIKLIKYINDSTIVGRDINTPLSSLVRTTRQCTNKETRDLNNWKNQVRTLHHPYTEFTIFFTAHRTLSETKNAFWDITQISTISQTQKS